MNINKQDLMFPNALAPIPPAIKKWKLLITFDLKALARLRSVSKKWCEWIDKTYSDDLTTMRDYYKKGCKWEIHFGNVGRVPPLPNKLEEILNSPCPFFENKKVKETHLLALIPATINQEPLTLDTLEKLIEKPNGGNPTKYSEYDKSTKEEYGQQVPDKTHWVLMTKDVIPGSRDKSDFEQEQLVAKYPHYRLPKVREVVICIAMEYIVSGNRLYGENPMTFTQCQERVSGGSAVLVGDFGPFGLSVIDDFDGYVSWYDSGQYEYYGVGPLREFCLKKEPMIIPNEIILQPTKKFTIQSFGQKEWETHFGKVGEVPPLPDNIEEILNSPCPFFEGKKVKDTHLLTLIPATLNQKILTLDKLGKLIEKPHAGHATKYEYCKSVKQRHGRQVPDKTHWVLMTKDVIPGSRNKSVYEQQQLVANYKHYRFPKVREAVSCIAMAYIVSGNRLYGRDPITYTRCQETVNTVNTEWPVVVGGFGPGGLSVSSSFFYYVREDYGVGPLREF